MNFKKESKYLSAFLDRKLSFVESILKKQTELGDLKAASNKAFIDREWHNPLGGEVRCEIKNLVSISLFYC